MVAKFLDARRTHAPRFGLDDDHSTRALMAALFFCIAMTTVLWPAMAFDTRTLDGANVWIKPQKFGVSLALHFFTVALLAQQMPRFARTGPVFTIPVYGSVVALMLEAVYVSVQAARARRSHYNFETQLEVFMYQLMGIGALLLVLVSLALAIQVLIHGQKEKQGLRWGTIIGMGIGFFATLGFAGYMSISEWRLVGETVTGEAVPFFGWSREVGDMRPAHFVALHMMQTLPLLGFILDKAKLPARISVPAVLVAALLQLALAAALFSQALAGKPFWPV
ncbi:MAG: hypothetical protein AAFR21_09015 [Pseudomonadota bacterium]